MASGEANEPKSVKPREEQEEMDPVPFGVAEGMGSVTGEWQAPVPQANEPSWLGFYDCSKEEQMARTEEVLRFTNGRLVALLDEQCKMLDAQRQDYVDRQEEFNEMQRQVGAMTNELNHKSKETETLRKLCETLREELKMTKRELACYQNTTHHNAHDQLLITQKGGSEAGLGQRAIATKLLRDSWRIVPKNCMCDY